MSLEFPHARLLVYNRLVKGGHCCVQAFVQSAVELGVLNSEVLNDLLFPLHQACCGSQFAARRVLEAALAMRGYSINNGDKGLVDELWDSVIKQIHEYKQKTSLVHEREAGVSPTTLDCSHMAPIVLDILLQHLTPYL